MKKQINFKKEVRESFQYLKETRNYIYVIIALFSLFSLIGFLVPAPLEIQEQILKFIEEILIQTEGMGQFELIWFIFSNICICCSRVR